MEPIVHQIELQLEQCRKALVSLDGILKEPFSAIIRDAAIKRFEYTFEVVWKLLKRYLILNEGIECHSPKNCIREAMMVGLISKPDTETFLEMIDDRNLIVHTYTEDMANELFEKLPGYYLLQNALFQSIEKKSQKTA